MGISGNGEFGRDQTATSLWWSMMGYQERINISSFTGSTNYPVANSSSDHRDNLRLNLTIRICEADNSLRQNVMILSF